MKLTKTELRNQQGRLQQFQKYLPTLQLKKMLLQLEVNNAQLEIEQYQSEFHLQETKVLAYAKLFTDRNSYDLYPAIKIVEVQKKFENIAGLEIPNFEKVVFQEIPYPLFDSPVWLDAAIVGLRKLISLREKVRIAYEKKAALERELREVSIRVNLFEKILIPRALEIIRKIKVFLGDQMLAAVAQAKVSKLKILERASS